RRAGAVLQPNDGRLWSSMGKDAQTHPQPAARFRNSMGWAKDPEARKRQEQALAKGRKELAKRRAQGQPAPSKPAARRAQPAPPVTAKPRAKAAPASKPAPAKPRSQPAK